MIFTILFCYHSKLYLFKKAFVCKYFENLRKTLIFVQSRVDPGQNRSTVPFFLPYKAYLGGSSDETAKTEGFRVTTCTGVITLRRAHFLFKFIYSLQKLRLGSRVSSSKFYGLGARSLPAQWTYKGLSKSSQTDAIRSILIKLCLQILQRV